MGLECLPTRHKEILGDDTGFGLAIQLLGGADPFEFCMTGDTGFRPDLCEQFSGCDLLLIHVGTMEDLGSEGASAPGEHLGFQGTVDLLSGLADPPGVALLGEWGQEFGYRDRRKRFAQMVALWSDTPATVLPTDLGMVVKLPETTVACGKDVFLPVDDLEVHDDGEKIRYLPSP